ncbi:hypothetical protein AWM68_01305 [Fictibacillus phosphorivorans]|uniref:Choloylglycine hydrolase/NAAA C-terminal domain-containing protein n=1 Tax=Fictibacillus phosphorivorans TaxID=1221500 RepID=A0A165P4H6_9BACL|nr:hypothetical protein [Fictibacillus phosphorivorans]KZE68935.1 hypothetical protein AWM68_01305 [Fictibacillus phosphorivorans]
MCTSFVLHKDKPYIGMNFDISKRPIKIALVGDDQLIISQKEGGRFLPAFGLNKNGTFMNLQIVDPNEEGKYRRGKNCVHIMRLFDEVLSGKVATAELPSYLQEKEVVNVPEYSVHSLIAAPNNKSYIVEPGRQYLDADSIKNDFMVLTNFSVADNLSSDLETIDGPGSERYKIVYSKIQNNVDDFSVEKGLTVLREACQFDGNYPTQLSLIFSPEENSVYFTLNGDFDKKFRFSFLENKITTISGFEKESDVVLTKKGILLSELEQF